MAASSNDLDNSYQGAFPLLVAFDLDYTLWDLWIDTHVTGPLKRPHGALNQVLDKYGETISFYQDVPDILRMLRTRGKEGGADKVIVAACSRTETPALARQCLQLLYLPPRKDHPALPAIEFFDELEIYPSSKLEHFRALHERTGIPYTDMLFFDDESRNAEVERLGVTFILASKGLTWKTFDRGLSQWRRKAGPSFT